jgi:5'-3' exonuclease
MSSNSAGKSSQIPISDNDDASSEKNEPYYLVMVLMRFIQKYKFSTKTEEQAKPLIYYAKESLWRPETFSSYQDAKDKDKCHWLIKSNIGFLYCCQCCGELRLLPPAIAAKELKDRPLGFRYSEYFK